MRRREAALLFQAKATSIAAGCPHLSESSLRYSNEAISHPAASNRRRKASSPIAPSSAALTGLEQTLHLLTQTFHKHRVETAAVYQSRERFTRQAG